MPPGAAAARAPDAGAVGARALGASRADRVVVVSAAVAVAAVAWWGLLRSHADAAHALLHPRSATDPSSALATSFALWLLMMVAMMLPAVLPWLAAFAEARGATGRRDTALFAAGYLAVWAGYSLAAAALQVLLLERALVAWPGAGSGSLAGGALLVSAGAFQLTPLKAACLSHCRSPIGYFLEHWESGPLGAFRMGLRHGGYCLGCCWALMALMLLTGTMSLAWMAALTLLLCVEKTAPGGERASRLAGLALVAWGLAVAAAI